MPMQPVSSFHVRRLPMIGGAAVGALGAALVFSTAVGQPAGLVATIEAFAARPATITTSTMLTAGGMTGVLRLEPVQAQAGGGTPCRAFAVSYGVRGGYAGDVCQSGPNTWRVTTLHSTPNYAASGAIAHGPVHHELLKPDAHIQMGQGAQAGSWGQTKTTLHVEPTAKPIVADAAKVAVPALTPTTPPPPLPQITPPAVLPPDQPQPHSATLQPPVTPPPPAPDPVTQAVADSTEQLPIIYNTPKQLEADRDTIISLVVESADVQRAEAAIAQLPGVAKRDTAALTSVVVAKLTGDPDSVTINPRFPDTQQISHLGNVTWAWDVRAKRPGETTLILQIFDIVDVKGTPTPVPLIAYTTQIRVKMGAVARTTYEIDRITPIWKFLGIGTPAALVIGFVAWLQSRRKKVAPTP